MVCKVLHNNNPKNPSAVQDNSNDDENNNSDKNTNNDGNDKDEYENKNVEDIIDKDRSILVDANENKESRVVPFGFSGRRL